MAFASRLKFVFLACLFCFGYAFAVSEDGKCSISLIKGLLSLSLVRVL